MADDKITFLFDEKPFLQAMNNMTQGMDKLTHSFEGSNKKSSDSVKTNVKSISNWAIAKFTLVAETVKHFASSMVDSFKENIPELGQSFGIMKDIIMKNLLYPMRLQLIPILQKMLNWVRDNTGFFVKLGSVIANAFRVVTSVISSAWKLLQAFGDGANEVFKDIFGTNISHIDEILNLALVKIALVIDFLAIKLKPLSKVLGAIFGDIIKDVKEFTKGFVDGLSGMFKGTDIFKDLEKNLTNIKNVLDLLTPAFKGLGELIGSIVGGMIKRFIIELSFLTTLLGNLAQFASGKMSGGDFLESAKTAGQDFFKNMKDSYVDQAKEMVNASKDTVMGFANQFDENSKNRKENKVHDAVIKPDGSIIRTDPADYLFATKNPNNMSKTKHISIGDIHINLTVTEGNVKQVAKEFGSTLAQQLRFSLLDESVAMGY